MSEDSKINNDSSVLEITDLKKSFGNFTVLKDINISIKKGESVVLLGKSGTGKSVILQCIIGLLYPTHGTIKVFNSDFSIDSLLHDAHK